MTVRAPGAAIVRNMPSTHGTPVLREIGVGDDRDDCRHQVCRHRFGEGEVDTCEVLVELPRNCQRAKIS